MTAGLLGIITTPRQGNKILPGVPWIADNSVFGKHGFPGNEAFIRWLITRPHQENCRFVVAPDVVGDAAATMKRSRPWFRVIRSLGFPVALAAQNGLTVEAVPWDDIDALFIGGDDEFKDGLDAVKLSVAAKLRGKHVHVGRVNGRRRLAHAFRFADSVDGTYLAFGPTTNLPKLLTWLEELERK